MPDVPRFRDRRKELEGLLHRAVGHEEGRPPRCKRRHLAVTEYKIIVQTHVVIDENVNQAHFMRNSQRCHRVFRTAHGGVP